VKELLGNINNTLIQRVFERKYGGDETSIPSVKYLSALPSAMTTNLSSVERVNGKDQVSYKMGAVVPDPTP
jgi:fatty acid synthase subunit beta